MAACVSHGEPETRSCLLESALGRSALCPRDRCAFWIDEPGVNVCLLEGTERSFRGDAGLAQRLVSLRGRLEQLRPEEDVYALR